jgi:hypothetical protein
MDMDQAAVFLAGSILTMLGFVVIIAGLLVINNILYKFWKPVRIFTADSWAAMNPPDGFASQDELNRVAPTIEQHKKEEK